MRYMTFGRGTGLRVSEYALGTGNFGTRWGAGADPAESRRMFDRFAEAGGTFLDTSDVYQAGEAESLLGDCLRAERERFVVATKFTNGAGKPHVSTTGNSRKNMVQSLEASLRRLGTSYVDLYWAHFPDAVTPVDEIVSAFDDLVRAGKVLYAGFSNFPAWRVARAATVAELRGWAPIVGVQTEYSLVSRTADRDLLPMAEAFGLGVALWSPLGGGLLTGKYRHSKEGRLTDWNGRATHVEDTAQKSAVIDAVLAVSQETGATPAQVAVAWMRSLTSSTAYVPVIGPRNVGQLDEYLGALDVTLSPAQLEKLEEASAVSLGSPHEANVRWANAVLGGDATAVTRHPTPVK